MGEKAEIIKNGHGGARAGSGKPKKKESEHVNFIIKKAIRLLYSKETDEEAQVEFIKDFAQTPRGQQYIAEKLYGKAPQIIEQEGAMFIQTPLIEFISEDKNKR